MMILFVDNVAESKYGTLSWDESVRQNSGIGIVLTGSSQILV